MNVAEQQELEAALRTFAEAAAASVRALAERLGPARLPFTGVPFAPRPRRDPHEA